MAHSKCLCVLREAFSPSFPPSPLLSGRLFRRCRTGEKERVTSVLRPFRASRLAFILWVSVVICFLETVTEEGRG